MTPLQGIAADIMAAVNSHEEEKLRSMNPHNRELFLLKKKRLQEQTRVITAAIQAGNNTAKTISEHTGISERVVHDVVKTMENVIVIRSVHKFKFKLKEAA